MTDSLDIRRKRLLFRSCHRGTREADLLLGAFAESHLAGFAEAALDQYEALLERSDAELFDWLTRRAAPPPEYDGEVTRLLLAFRYKPARDMKRREFIAMLGGTAVARPLAARAQQKAMPVIGFLGSSRVLSAARVAAFRERLSEAGYVEGKNLAIEYRWSEGHYDRLPAFAADLVDRKVDLIVVTGGSPAAFAAKNATSTIPIIFLGGSDLIATGLVASLARPGGNLTGLIILGRELAPKRLELLSELIPQAAIIAVLVNPTKSDTEDLIKEMQEAARAKGVQLAILKAGTKNEIDAAFTALAQLRVGGLVVASDAFFATRREQIVALASRHAVPTIYDWREFAVSGGLISYGISFKAYYRQLGTYAAQILKGANPADLPVQQPTTFELVINLKTAKTLGLTVPQSLLVRADEVIE